MNRGDIVIAAAAGDYGKPRPAVVIQTDALPDAHASVVICQITSTLVEASMLRLTLEPTSANGLRLRSQVMADKPMTVRRAKIGRTLGRLTESEIDRLNQILIVILGLGD